MISIVDSFKYPLPWHLVWFSSGCHPSGQTHCFSIREGSRTTQRWSQPQPSSMAGRISTVPEPKCWPSSTSVSLSIASGETKEKPPSPLELATALPPNRRHSKSNCLNHFLDRTSFLLGMISSDIFLKEASLKIVDFLKEFLENSAIQILETLSRCFTVFLLVTYTQDKRS